MLASREEMGAWVEAMQMPFDADDEPSSSSSLGVLEDGDGPSTCHQRGEGGAAVDDMAEQEALGGA